MALGLTARLFFFRKAALVAEVVSAAPAERNREEKESSGREVMAVTAVTGSPDQAELEEMVQPEEPVTILAVAVVTALMDSP